MNKKSDKLDITLFFYYIKKYWNLTKEQFEEILKVHNKNKIYEDIIHYGCCELTCINCIQQYECELPKGEKL